MKKIYFLFVFVIFTLCGDVNAGGPGSSVVLTLLEPLSAFSAGLGDAAVALSGSPCLLKSNPASIYSVDSVRTTFMYNRGIGGDNYAASTVVVPLKNLSLGRSFQYYSTGEISMYDSSGEQKLTETGQRDIIYTLAASGLIYEIPVGVNFKFIHSSIFGESGTAFAADVGALIPGAFSEGNADVGIAVRNFGTKIEYLNVEEKLPLNIAVGLSSTKIFTDSSLNTLLELPYYINEKEILVLGGIQYLFQDRFAVRGGYKLNLFDVTVRDISLTFGLGAVFGDFSIDYAAGFAEERSTLHNISLNYNLGVLNAQRRKVRW